MEEMRASMVAEGNNKGLNGLLQEVMLRFLTVLMALLEDFRAGRLAPVTPMAGEAGASGSGVSAAVSNREHA